MNADLRYKSFEINALTALPTDSASYLQVYFRHPSLGSKIYIERLPGMKHYRGIDLNVATKKILIPQNKRSTADEERELQLIACTHHPNPNPNPNLHPHFFQKLFFKVNFTSFYAYWTLLTVFPHRRPTGIISFLCKGHST